MSFTAANLFQIGGGYMINRIYQNLTHYLENSIAFNLYEFAEIKRLGGGEII